MKCAGLLAGVVVAWSATGIFIDACGPGGRPEPALRDHCVSTSYSFAQSFANKETAEEWIKELHQFKVKGIKITDIHTYSEAGADL